MKNTNSRFATKTEITSGEYAGLIIEQIWHASLNGLKAILIAHKAIPNFEARAFVPSDFSLDEILNEVVQNVRLKVAI